MRTRHALLTLIAALLGMAACDGSPTDVSEPPRLRTVEVLTGEQAPVAFREYLLAHANKDWDQRPDLYRSRGIDIEERRTRLNGLIQPVLPLAASSDCDDPSFCQPEPGEGDDDSDEELAITNFYVNVWSNGTSAGLYTEADRSANLVHSVDVSIDGEFIGSDGASSSNTEWLSSVHDWECGVEGGHVDADSQHRAYKGLNDRREYDFGWGTCGEEQ